MKNIFKIFSLMAMSAFALTSCIEETLPEDNTATADQVAASPTAMEAALRGIPSQMSQGYYVYESQVHETDMGYPAYMIAQTEFLGDMFPAGDSGYDWYTAYNSTEYNMGENSYPSYLSWFTFYKYVKAANDVIGVVDINDKNLNESVKGAAGVAYAFRAFNYYMLTVLFEPKANIYTDCSDVLGLTVPFVTEKTTNDIAKNNPRATHEEMIKFIINDLEIAEECLKNYTPESKTLPDLATTYAIRAKVHMWDEDYENAAKYARMAIETSGATPTTMEQWTSTTDAFNKPNQAWLWYAHYDAEQMGNLCNFIGWMSSEAQWGYSTLTKPVINRALYDKIAHSDFRKEAFVDPDRENHPRKSVMGEEWLAEAPDYAALKFRCKEGDTETYTVGAAVDLPIIRVEEMFLIEAEAVAHTQGVGAGKQLLESFVQTRDPQYSCYQTELRDFQIEVLTQMRIEFWGEGNAFPHAKRIQPGIMQNYTGTNAVEEIHLINCAGMKPTWNMVIPISEVQANAALKGKNNPDPTGTVMCPSEVDVYAPGNNTIN